MPYYKQISKTIEERGMGVIWAATIEEAKETFLIEDPEWDLIECYSETLECEEDGTIIRENRMVPVYWIAGDTLAYEQVEVYSDRGDWLETLLNLLEQEIQEDDTEYKKECLVIKKARSFYTKGNWDAVETHLHELKDLVMTGFNVIEFGTTEIPIP